MDNQFTLFDILPDDDPTKNTFISQESTDWKWSLGGGAIRRKMV